MKICRKCEEPVTHSGLCRIHYNEKMKTYMLNRYHKRRATYVAEWGGQCVDCGSEEELEFDHADASSKEIPVGKLFTSYTDSKIRAELDKCVLRCKSCHLVKSQNEDWNIVEHGGGVSGKKSCPCVPCKAKKSEYMRERRLRKLEQE